MTWRRGVPVVSIKYPRLNQLALRGLTHSLAAGRPFMHRFLVLLTLVTAAAPGGMPAMAIGVGLPI